MTNSYHTERAFRRGKQAASEGKAKTENPYGEGNLKMEREAWERGWEKGAKK